MSKISDEIQKEIDKGEGISMICLDGLNGFAWFCGGRVGFAEDGGGWLANGNIVWDMLGNLLIRGAFESNQNGNRVTIDPQGSIRMINSADEEIMTIHTKYGTPYIRFKYKELDIESEVTLSSSGLEIINDGYLIFSINSRSGEMFINPDKIPNSRDNLIPGSIYRTGETLKVKVGL